MFNRRHTIAAAIASVQAQTCADFELIVVDDGSTDDTREMVASVGDPRIRLLVHKQNCGAAAARNTGLEAAVGRYIAFLDSDDTWRPGKLERQLSGFASRGPRTLASCTGFALVRQRSGVSVNRILERGPNWFSTLLDGCFVSPGTTLLAERSAFEQVGLFDATLRRFEDWDWLLRYLEHFEFAVVPEVLADVHVAVYAPPAIVAASAARLFERQHERIARLRGSGGVRIFRASLLIEQTVSCAADKRYASAAQCLFRAARISPARVTRFLTRAVRKFGMRDF